MMVRWYDSIHVVVVGLLFIIWLGWVCVRVLVLVRVHVRVRAAWSAASNVLALREKTKKQKSGQGCGSRESRHSPNFMAPPPHCTRTDAPTHQRTLTGTHHQVTPMVVKSFFFVKSLTMLKSSVLGEVIEQDKVGWCGRVVASCMMGRW